LRSSVSPGSADLGDAELRDTRRAPGVEQVNSAELRLLSAVSAADNQIGTFIPAVACPRATAPLSWLIGPHIFSML
jgi:hypothetical protein